ncbi:MAG: hypothetical protein J6B75_10600 [Ruminococcus sp.]|nr:hypothetical protein [Ruminococcus sp.]
MTISRIDDADNLHVTYQQKVTSVIWMRVIISIIVLFFGTIAWGFAEMETEYGGIVPMIAALIIALLILSGYLKMSRNNNYFAAYVFDENILYRVDLTEAFGNDTLLGKSYSINNRNGVFQRMKVTANMQKIRETAHLDAFICNKDVINYGGYVIENVFDISEDREFLRVKAQLKGFRLFNSYSRKKTIYIPKSFTNFDALRYELEKLI